MCGIAGILYPDHAERVSPRRLDRMVDALAHRGPDDRGCYVAGSIGLGMRRLSIIDVEGGHQPMASPTGDVQVVYNGECYNHQDLRADLISLGHRFRTQCDTEVVLHGYRAWGIEGLARRMNGIYAFCIWDASKQAAFLCRDRLGVKPLYFVERNGRLAFSSELRSLMHCGLALPKIDEVALWGYLAYQFTPTEHTLISGIVKLPPAHILEWRRGKIAYRRYWDFPDEGEDETCERAERVEALRALLWDTVERQMMSDVPIGCFLSGGLDSTIIACMMAKRSNHPLRTFSIAFPGQPDCDESAYFERLAREIQAQHQTIDFSEKEIIDTLDEFAWSMDEPVADPAMLPTYLLSKAAAREVKVVLTGEGADEVFAGYPYYRPLVHGWGGSGRPASDRIAGWLAFTNDLSDRLGVYMPGPRNDQTSAISNFPYAIDPTFIRNLLHPARRPQPERMAGFTSKVERMAIARLRKASPLQAALALDTQLWLANDLMPKLDKMTMAHSLEGRVPFLDHRIVEFAYTLPAKFKVGPEHGKMILRDAVKGIIPDRMLMRVKHGFNVPLYQWFRTSLVEFTRSALMGPTLADTGLFERKGLEALLAAHMDMDVNFARPIWELICLSRWYERLQREWTQIIGPDEASATVIGDASRSPRCLAEASPAAVTPPTDDANNHYHVAVNDHVRGAGSITRLPRDTIRGQCDIVVPIYEGVNYVRDLLRSIHRNTDYPWHVILIDDSCNKTTFAALQALVAGDERVELHENETNLGFVGSSNRGIARATGEYVCIMNTDTLTSPQWLSRMIRCAESDPRIAVVNPVSNSCVNMSVAMAPGLNLNSMAVQVARRSRRKYPDITTAVGFCMLVKRQYLDWLGGFDDAYGRGYCEESDLCMRYTEAGLRVVTADDAFVYHKGCGSFGTWLERYEINRRIFDRRWDEAYLRDYYEFLARNPLQYLRDSLMRDTINRDDWTASTVMAADRFIRQDRRRHRDAIDATVLSHASEHHGNENGNGHAESPGHGNGSRQVTLSEEPARRDDAPATDRVAGALWRRPVVSTPFANTGGAAKVKYALRRPRTGPDPMQRGVRYPTRTYVDGLPETRGLRVTFLIAEDMPICGGIISIVQLAREMLLMGHDVKLVTRCPEVDPERFNLPAQPLSFPTIEELVRLFPPSDIVIGTFWTTVYNYMPALRERYDFVSAYFVQDYEVYFYPERDYENRRRAGMTYDMTEHRIVKSKWLAGLIREKQGVECDQIHLGLDLGVFRNRKATDQIGLPVRVLSVARPGDTRRGFDEAVEAFEMVHTQRPDVEFVFFGTPDGDMPELPFPIVNAGRIQDQNKVAELIGSCDVLIDSSLFQGFGRPGLEAMACGTACVLTSEGGVNEYARNEVNCLMVRPKDNKAMAAAILRLISDDGLRNRLRTAGLETAQRFCHVDEAKLHIETFKRWLAEKYSSRTADRDSALVHA